MKKSSYIKPDANDDANILSEPAMVYGYVNQSNYEPALIERVDETVSRPQKILQPDHHLRSAITADELIKRIHEDKRRKFPA
jgi:hypothetical protein